MDGRRSNEAADDEETKAFRDAGGEMHPVKTVSPNGAASKNRADQKEDESDKKEDSEESGNKKGGDDKEGEGQKGDEKKDEEKKQSPEEKRKAARKKWIVGGIVLVVLIIGLMIGIPYYLHARHFEETDDAFIDSHVERVGPQVAGRVVEVKVKDNQLINTGDIVLLIDPADFNVAIATAEANIAEQRGKLAQAVAQKSVAEAGVEQSKADLEQATVNRQNAETNLKRNEGLSAEAISRQRLDDLHAAAVTAEANQTASEKRLLAAQAQITLAESQIKAAEGQVQSAQAQLDQANLNLSYTTVRSRVGGRVTRRDVQAGDYVQVGQPIMSIVPHEIWVTANYKETQLTDMRPGQPVDVEVDAYPDEVFHGKVDSIQAGSGAAFSLLPPENATGNYVKVVQRVPVKIVFDDTESDAYKKLSPGMSVVPKARVR